MSETTDRHAKRELYGYSFGFPVGISLRWSPLSNVGITPVGECDITGCSNASYTWLDKLHCTKGTSLLLCRTHFDMYQSDIQAVMLKRSLEYIERIHGEGCLVEDLIDVPSGGFRIQARLPDLRQVTYHISGDELLTNYGADLLEWSTDGEVRVKDYTPASIRKAMLANHAAISRKVIESQLQYAYGLEAALDDLFRERG